MSATLSLPAGWVSTRLGDCTQVITKGTTPTTFGHEYQTQGIRFVKVENLSAGHIDQESIVAFIDEVANAQLGRSQLKVGDVLFSIAGTIGRTAIVRAEDLPANTNQAVAIIRGFAPILSPFFLRLFLESATAQQEASSRARGGAMNNVSLGDVANLCVPVPPPREQIEIVAEIEKQFTRLDAAVTALKRVQANLKRFRAAALKAACEGRLVPTEAELVREEGRRYETGEQLLGRILKERRAKWETDQLAKMVAAGKPSKNDEWKKKYREPEPADTSSLPPLPDGWAWATIDQVSVCLDGQRVPVNKEERLRRCGDIPYYGANGKVGVIDDYLFDESLVLVVEDETFVGRTLPFSYLIKGKSWVNNHAHVLRPTGAVTPEFLNYSLAFYPFTPLTTGSTGRRKLTQKALLQAPYPLPPIAEQIRIASEVERMLSIGDEIDRDLQMDIERADRLRQSILKFAFEGKLVPQNPNDEPATALLERIRAEQNAGRETVKKVRRPRALSAGKKA